MVTTNPQFPLKESAAITTNPQPPLKGEGDREAVEGLSKSAQYYEGNPSVSGYRRCQLPFQGSHGGAKVTALARQRPGSLV